MLLIHKTGTAPAARTAVTAHGNILLDGNVLLIITLSILSVKINEGSDKV